MLKMELHLNKNGNIEKLLYSKDYNLDIALNLIMKRNLLKHKLIKDEEK